MKKEAVLHIPMSQYAHGLDEKHIVFRLRCAKGDLKSCTLYYGDTACRVTPIVFTPVAMRVAASDLYHDYWQVVLDSPYKRLYYYFHLNDGTERVLYYGDVFTDHLVDDRSQYFKLRSTTGQTLRLCLTGSMTLWCTIFSPTALPQGSNTFPFRIEPLTIMVSPYAANWAAHCGVLPTMLTIWKSWA